MRKIMGVLLLLSLLFISSCGIMGGYSGRSTPGIDYAKGNLGIVMNFLPNSPPTEIYNGDPLDLMVEFSNKGIYDIILGQGFLYLSGFDDRYFVDLAWDNMRTFEAPGISEFNPYGEIYGTVSFRERNVSIPPEVPYFDQTFKVTACYYYETYAYFV